MKKRVFSIVLCLVMLCSVLSVGAFAAEAEPTGEVTVYITKGMFTEGGLNQSQEFLGMDVVDDHLFDSDKPEFSVQAIDLSSIDYDVVRALYKYPGAETAGTAYKDYNVLDAIIAALTSEYAKNVVTEVNGGWDAHPLEGQPGGYVNSFTPGGVPEAYGPDPEEVDGVKYDRYYGTGWQIVVEQNGVATPLTSYATSYALSDGMTIVFDLSPYVIYYPAA